MNIFVFDLDNTLIMTDALNNKAYNFALKQYGLPQIYGVKRITREVIKQHFPTIPHYLFNQLIIEKQVFFKNNIHLTTLNKALYTKLQQLDKNSCVLWTKADYLRTIYLLNHYSMTSLFSFIFYSPKTAINNDIQTICTKKQCTINDISFWEDDITNINQLKKLHINNITQVFPIE